jgi:uncharacterized protein (DUF302 family)
MRQRLLGATLAILTLAIGVIFAGQAHADGDGLIVLKSDFGVTKTLDRLGIALERKGIKVFARINHASGAASVGLELPPTAVIIFGTPKIGTPLMTSNPAIGLDLPLKAVAWQTADGVVMLAYSDPAWLAKRYGIDDRDGVFKKMAGALAKFTAMATTRGALPAE